MKEFLRRVSEVRGTLRALTHRNENILLLVTNKWNELREVKTNKYTLAV